jgi:acyl dehydratase
VAHTAYEDLEPGRVVELGSTRIDRDEMLGFARRFDPQPLHLDEHAARDSLFGGLCASGWYTASLWMRAYVDTVLADSTAQGSPGARELSWLAPVWPGDTLDFRLEVRSRRLSASRPNLGLVDMIGTAHRDDQCVLRIAFTGLFNPRSHQ